MRDLYRIDDDTLLMVASDRLSAFDVVMAEPVPDKGSILTAMSNDWFSFLSPLAANHLVAIEPAEIATLLSVDVDDLAAAGLLGRSVVVRSLDMMPIECIVRGRLTGSAWKEYRESGTVHGMEVPSGLIEADALPSPMFTPSTKAASGHDENISIDQAADLVGRDIVDRASELCLGLFEAASQRAADVGVVVADTKFELGWLDGELVLGDEVLTPDSSRLWDAVDLVPGRTPTGYDKQPVRDFLESTGWDKRPPPPPLPPDVIAATRDRYIAIFRRISGRDLEFSY